MQCRHSVAVKNCPREAPIEITTNKTLPQNQEPSAPENLQLAQLPVQRRGQD